MNTTNEKFKITPVRSGIIFGPAEAVADIVRRAHTLLGIPDDLLAELR